MKGFEKKKCTKLDKLSNEYTFWYVGKSSWKNK